MPSGVVVGAGGPPRPRPPPPPPAPPRIQMPEKSTLPSAVRGAGASRFGVPSALRGTPGVGYEGHCAPIEGASVAISSAVTPAVKSRHLICHSPAFDSRRLYRLCVSNRNALGESGIEIGLDTFTRSRYMHIGKQGRKRIGHQRHMKNLFPFARVVTRGSVGVAVTLCVWLQAQTSHSRQVSSGWRVRRRARPPARSRPRPAPVICSIGTASRATTNGSRLRT